MTQITAGITLSVDFDGVSGLHNVRIVASGANGYLTATNYEVTIAAGTINGVSAVGYVVGAFSIENRSALVPTVAARTLDVSAGGEAGLDWANVGSPTTALNLSATNIDVDQAVASVSGAVGSVTGAVGSVTGLTASNLDATVSSRATPAQVNTEADTALADYGALKPTVASRTLDVTATGGAGIDWANVENPTTALNLSATNIDVDQVVASVSGAVASVTGLTAANLDATISSRATPAQVTTQVTAIVGAAGVSLTAIPWNAAWDAEVESEVADALATTIADSVPADGTRPSVNQALYMLTQFMLEKGVVGTTVTVNKPDGTTALFTLTLNDGTTPTAITRAT